MQRIHRVHLSGGHGFFCRISTILRTQQRRRGGGEHEAWTAFLADTVTPRFPGGLTVVDGAGQWRGSSGVIERERSKVLIILTVPGEEGMRLTGEISQEYESRFNQETVLRVVRTACVSFS